MSVAVRHRDHSIALLVFAPSIVLSKAVRLFKDLRIEEAGRQINESSHQERKVAYSITSMIISCVESLSHSHTGHQCELKN